MTDNRRSRIGMLITLTVLTAASHGLTQACIHQAGVVTEKLSKGDGKAEGASWIDDRLLKPDPHLDRLSGCMGRIVTGGFSMATLIFAAILAILGAANSRQQRLGAVEVAAWCVNALALVYLVIRWIRFLT